MKLIASSSYLPNKIVMNKELSEKLGVTEEFIEKRTGIKQRYFTENETIEEMAIKATEKLIEKTKISIETIDLIIVATTSTNKIMPGISNYVQKELKIPKCICLDILAGCAGYINAVDIAQLYMKAGKVKRAIIIGADILSKCTNESDVGTAIILADGMGATLYEASDNLYYSNIQSIPDNNDILEYNLNNKIKMDGLAIYKYAVTETVKNIQQLLLEANEKIENIKYIIPHQSNLKIILAIASRLKIEREKIFTNIETVGNTFCASIPIALEQILDNNLLNQGDKIILLGYGGGLNTGSILLEGAVVSTSHTNRNKIKIDV